MLEPAGPSEIDSKPETELTCPCAFSIDQGLVPQRPRPLFRYRNFDRLTLPILCDPIIVRIIHRSDLPHVTG
jgi:hypothetical protein